MKFLGLPAASRLRGPNSYTGKFLRRERGIGLEVAMRPSSDSQSRLGVVVARKQVAKAVGRNRMKRVIREWFRIRRAQFPPMDLVVRVRLPLTRIETIVELDSLCAKLC